MTLISAFRLHRAAVLCADSEENYGDFRRSVQKLEPREMGKLQVIIGGSGIGSLIESFITKLREKLDFEQTADLAQLKQIIERRLANFYRNEVATYARGDDIEKEHKFIIAARSTVAETFEVWASRHTTLIPVTSYELAGVEDLLYDHATKRLYRPDLTIAQAVLASVNLMAIAKETSTYVRGDTQLAVVTGANIWIENADYVKTMEGRIQAYEREVNDLFLACADTSLSVSALQELIGKFSESALQLHRQHIDETMAKLTIHNIMGTNDPYPKRPLGSVVTMYSTPPHLRLEHNPEENRRHIEQLKRAMEIANKQAERQHHLQTLVDLIESKKIENEQARANFEHLIQGREILYVGDERVQITGSGSIS